MAFNLPPGVTARDLDLIDGPTEEEIDEWYDRLVDEAVDRARDAEL